MKTETSNRHYPSLNLRCLLTLLPAFVVGALAFVQSSAGGQFESTGSMATARSQHTATLLANGKVLVAGGNNTIGHVAGAELYDPSTGTWALTGSMAAARYLHTATLLPNGKVLVAGGLGDFGLLASAELYDPAVY